MTCQENIHHLHGCQSMSDLPALLSASCGPSLIIVEDLEESDFIRISRLEKMLLSVSQSRGLLVVITTRAGSNIINSRALEVSSELPVNRDKLEQDELVKLLLSSDVKHFPGSREKESDATLCSWRGPEFWQNFGVHVLVRSKFGPSPRAECRITFLFAGL